MRFWSKLRFLPQKVVVLSLCKIAEYIWHICYSFSDIAPYKGEGLGNKHVKIDLCRISTSNPSWFFKVVEYHPKCIYCIELDKSYTEQFEFCKYLYHNKSYCWSKLTIFVVFSEFRDYKKAYLACRIEGTVADKKIRFFCCHFHIFEDIATKFGILM